MKDDLIEILWPSTEVLMQKLEEVPKCIKRSTQILIFKTSLNKAL